MEVRDRGLIEIIRGRSSFVIRQRSDVI